MWFASERWVVGGVESGAPSAGSVRSEARASNRERTERTRMSMTERFDALGEKEKVGGGAVLLVAGVLILALLTFAGVGSRALQIVLGTVGVITVVIGVLSIGISEKSV